MLNWSVAGTPVIPGFMIEPLVDAALQNCAGETALDLYAGVGLCALPMARRFKSVTAVESGSDAATRPPAAT